MSELLGLVVEVRPLQAHFRVPYKSLLLDSYPFPPRTTAIGMLAAAMGLSEMDYRDYLPRLKYGVIIDDPGARAVEIAAIYKNSHSPIYPINRVLYLRPKYRMFFTGDDDIIEAAYEAFRDPVFTPYLGDSESLFRPAGRDYLRIVNVETGKETVLRSVIPARAWDSGGKFMVLRRNNLTPREYRVPVGFEYIGKRRRAIYMRTVVFAGGYVELENPIGVLRFDGEPVFVF